jgi:fructose/tagatose bisphosphate aldolase
VAEQSQCPSRRRYRATIEAAREREYAYPAVNVSSSESLNADLRGFADARSDGIVQITNVINAGEVGRAPVGRAVQFSASAAPTRLALAHPLAHRE